MKRRSPWLAFAACVLLRGGAASAMAAPKPALSMSCAAAAAEAELAKRGLSADHVVSSVSLVRDGERTTYYTVKIDPPLPASQAAPSQTYGFRIAMSGEVTIDALTSK